MEDVRILLPFLFTKGTFTSVVLCWICRKCMSYYGSGLWKCHDCDVEVRN